MAEVALLRLQQPRGNDVACGVIGKKIGKLQFRQPVELFVLPKRVVGIEADRGQGALRHRYVRFAHVMIAGIYSVAKRKQG